jgi:hypothetical protein
MTVKIVFTVGRVAGVHCLRNSGSLERDFAVHRAKEAWNLLDDEDKA